MSNLIEPIIKRLATVVSYGRHLIGLQPSTVPHELPQRDPCPGPYRPELWYPDKESAYHVTDDERRYIICLETWGEPRRNFEAGVPWLRDEAAPAWIESQRCISSVTVNWDAERQRIITEFRCEETETTEDPGAPWITAEIMAEYWHRHMDFTPADEMIEGEYDSGDTVIVAVYPIQDSSATAEAVDQ